MRTWLVVRKAVSEANSPKAQGSSMKLGTTLGSAVAIANSAFSRATKWMVCSTTGAPEGRKLARQRQRQVAFIVQNLRDCVFRMLAVEGVGALRAGKARLVEDEIHALRHIGVVGAVDLAHPPAPLRARRAGRHQKILHLRVGAAAVGHQSDMHRPLRAVADVLRPQQRKGGACLFQNVEHKDSLGTLRAA